MIGWIVWCVMVLIVSVPVARWYVKPWFPERWK